MLGLFISGRVSGANLHAVKIGSKRSGPRQSVSLGPYAYTAPNAQAPLDVHGVVGGIDFFSV